jgi:hypothetical protein
MAGVPNVPKLLMLGQSIWLVQNKIKLKLKFASVG